MDRRISNYVDGGLNRVVSFTDRFHFIVCDLFLIIGWGCNLFCF